MGLYVGDSLARYGFPAGHPLGLDRQGAFFRETRARGLDARVRIMNPDRAATEVELTRFHRPEFIDKVRHAERDALKFLDQGDTPVFPGVFEASALVVGAALDGLQRVMAGELTRTFQPIGGLHHAGRDHAAGFCVFNDIGVVIETLRRMHDVTRIGYVDIDVHHGDGIFYAYESDPDLIMADIHESGRSLYPGTGDTDETGREAAVGTKLNLPLPAGSGDDAFLSVWPQVEAHLERLQPEFLIFQCGADGLEGDPLAHLKYSAAVHAHAARRMRALADRLCRGRLMAFGGGGYDRSNLARAWNNVVEELLA